MIFRQERAIIDKITPDKYTLLFLYPKKGVVHLNSKFSGHP